MRTHLGKYPGSRLKGSERYSKLYHFTKFETFKKIWETKSLKFGSIPELNDINEAFKTISIDVIDFPLAKEDYVDLFNKAYRTIYQYKQISLTKDYDSYIKGCMSPMMWGHYGEKGNGVCIELDFSKIHFPGDVIFGEVKYKKLSKLFKLDPILFHKPCLMEKHIESKIKKIFFTKTADWKGENEFRIISNNHNYLDISSAISMIYIAKLNQTNSFEVENIVDGKVPVEIIRFVDQQNGDRIPIFSDSKTIRDQLNGVFKR